MRATRRLFSSILLVLIFAGLALGFQNCTPKNAGSAALATTSAGPDAQNATAEHGGGNGYDGKPTYINIDTTGVCHEPVRAVIKVIDELYGEIQREDCSDLATPKKVLLTDVGILAHNPGNAVHDNRVYDLLSARTDPRFSDASITQYLCRGSQTNKNTGERQVADVVIRQNLKTGFAETAQVLMGIYAADGSMVRSLDSSELKLRNISTEVTGRLKYVTGIVGTYGITLWIDKSGEPKTGKLSFVDLPYVGRDLESDYDFRDYERVIQNLTCYMR